MQLSAQFPLQHLQKEEEIDFQFVAEHAGIAHELCQANVVFNELGGRGPGHQRQLHLVAVVCEVHKVVLDALDSGNKKKTTTKYCSRATFGE